MSGHSVLSRLHGEAMGCVRRRSGIEARWLEDLNLFHGNYTPELKSSLKKSGRSSLFVNYLRPKCTTLAAKLSDMLFPTDDRNYGIRPTPVPDLYGQSKEEKQMALQAAQEAARKMEDQIHDSLIECQYAEQCREVIEDACKIGTGILKGPILSDEGRKRWVYDEASETHVMEWRSNFRPVFWRVDPWDFFPWQKENAVFQRHLYFPPDIRNLARDEQYFKPALRRMLEEGPKDNIPSYYQDLRSLEESSLSYDDQTCFIVWEYHGVVSQQELSALAEMIGDTRIVSDLSDDDAAIDPLYQPEIQLWFTKKEVLRLNIHHLDSGETIYSKFMIGESESSDFGSSVMRTSRDAQLAICAAWRSMMDNGGMTSGPNAIIDQSMIEPADGQMVLSGRKIWLKKSSIAPVANPPFEIFNFPSNQVEMANIIEMAKKAIDEETGVSPLTQGDQSANTARTMGEVSILATSANIIFRRYVKMFDDKITAPSIRRLYDFYMQFSDNDEIKGDFNVEARGSSVLLVRELQSANLRSFLLTFGLGTPYQDYLKDGGLPVLRKLLQSLMIPSDEILKSLDVLQQEAEELAQAPESIQEDSAVAVAKIRAQVEMEKMAITAQMKEMDHQIKIMQISENTGIAIEKIKSDLQRETVRKDSKERILAAELGGEIKLAQKGLAVGGGGYY